MEQFEPLGGDLHIKLGGASDVAARPAETGDQAKPHRIAASGEHDGNGRACRPGRQRRGRTGRGDHGNLAADEIGHQLRQPIVLTVRPTIFRSPRSVPST